MLTLQGNVIQRPSPYFQQCSFTTTIKACSNMYFQKCVLIIHWIPRIHLQPINSKKWKKLPSNTFPSRGVLEFYQMKAKVQLQMLQSHEHAPFISNTKCRWKCSAVKEPTVWKNSVSHSCTKDPQITGKLTSVSSCVWVRKKKKKKKEFLILFKHVFPVFALFYFKRKSDSAAKTITC